MTDLLIVIDMQRDFVSGALGSPEARAITPAVAARIRRAKKEGGTPVVLTLDTHETNIWIPAKDASSPFRTASAIRRAGRLNRKSPPNVRRI